MTAAEKLRQWIEKIHDGDEQAARGGDVETGIPAPFDRNHESKSVAAEMLDDSWVGWTYWYGGGKHAEPEAIPWIDEAYDVTVEKVVEVVMKYRKTTEDV